MTRPISPCKSCGDRRPGGFVWWPKVRKHRELWRKNKTYVSHCLLVWEASANDAAWTRINHREPYHFVELERVRVCWVCQQKKARTA